MLRLSRILLPLLLLLLLASFVRGDEFDDLRLKWRDTIAGAGYDPADASVAARLASIANSATSHRSTMDKSAGRTFLWSDLASTTDSSHITSAYGRLRATALAYATPGCTLAGNPDLLADTLGGLDWMNANRYGAATAQYGNWWDWEIGTPIHLTDIGVLLHDQLSSAQLTSYMNAVEHQVPTPDMTQANKVWKARAVGVRGCLVRSSAKIALCRDAFSAVFPYVASGDGFYTDGSFIQHDYHPYTAGYGAALIGTMAPLLQWLSGSSWAVTDPARANLYRWVFDSYEPVIYRGNTFDLVRGREPGRSGSAPNSQGMMEAILQIAGFAPAEEAARMKSMVKEWALADTTRDFVSSRGLPTLMLARNLMEDPAVVRRGELVAHYTFPKMDRVIHLGAGYGFGLSLCSTRIANFESINGENLRGWFTGDGQTTLYNADLNAFADAYWATVDHYRLPGVTADVTHSKLPHQSSSLGPRAQGQGTRSPHSWVGGATLGTFGAAGMQFKGAGVTLTGKKSWFMFDDEIVCLGAAISSTDSRPIETTVENRKLSSSGDNPFTVDGAVKPRVPGWSETMPAVGWAHLAGQVPGADIGYFFPAKPSLFARREARTGAWSDIDSDASTSPITRNYLRISFEHGNNPAGASYQYVLLPGRNSTRTASYAAAPQVTVLANTTDVQAVAESTLGITAANFWNDGVRTAGPVTANRKASVLVRHDPPFVEIAVSDPTQLNTGGIDLQIALDGGTPVSADPGITIRQSTPAIDLSVATANSAGKTFRARFYQLAPETVTLAPVADAYAYDGSADSNYGTASSLVVKKSGPGFNRESFLRFDVPPASGGVRLAATLTLGCLSASSPGVHGVAKVDDNNWSETGLTWNNKPASGPVLATWTPAANAPSSADVTAALPASGLVSFKVSATTQTADGFVTYGSRENTTAENRPLLRLAVGHTPPDVRITSPADGEFVAGPGPLAITAEATASDGAIASVAFHDGAALLTTDSMPPYSAAPVLAAGTHFLTAVATDTHGLSRTSLVTRIEIPHPPAARPKDLSTPRGTSVEVDLLPLASDADTALSSLRFDLGPATHGTAALLPDGHTVRFTPATGYSGPATFTFTVTDPTRHPRALLNYAFQNGDLTDTTGQFRDGTLTVQGNGTAAFPDDSPLPGYTRSIALTENGTAGAARVEKTLSGVLSLVNGDWTIAGWFKRQSAANQDSILQLGESGGYGSNAMTLAFYGASSTLDLRNYADNVQDVSLSKTGVATGIWHHFAIVRSGSTLSWYHNGGLVGSDSSFRFGFPDAQSVKFGGVAVSVTDRWLNGSLADLAVFDDDLSAGEISRLQTTPAHWLGGQSASATVNIAVLHPPVASPASRVCARDVPVDLDLQALATDADTPLSALRFAVGPATNGSVALLGDGCTARFTPNPGHLGLASFAFTVHDATPDPRTWLNWPLRDGSAADLTPNARHGTLILQGNGECRAEPQVPPALAPQHRQSLGLAENGEAGAARIECGVQVLDPVGADWTFAGWFRRNSEATIDSILQLGESGGWGNNALSLACPENQTIELRNYAGATADVQITRASLPAGAWHHFAIVRSGAALRLYVNGIPAGADSEFAFAFDPAKPLKLGGVGSASNSALFTRWLNGQFADFAIFQAALTETEIAKLTAHPAAYLGSQSSSSAVSLEVVSPVDSWRHASFGTTVNSGLFADSADKDRDGLPNLLEYATGNDPNAPDPAPVALAPNGGTIDFFYTRSKFATDVRYSVEWSDTLSGEWSVSGVGQPLVIGEDSTTQRIRVTVPAGSDVQRRFVRLRATLF